MDKTKTDTSLRRSLKGCRLERELNLAARSLGCRITRMHLQRAWEEERRKKHREVQG